MLQVMSILLQLLVFNYGLVCPLFAGVQVVKDARGRTFLAPSGTPKVVSGFVGADEILVDLLKEEPEKILALSPLSQDQRYSAIFQEAHRWPKPFGQELEGLVSLKPDLVVVAQFSRPEWLRKLDQAGIKSFLLGSFTSLEDIETNILTLGFLTGKQTEAKGLVNDMNQQLSTLKKTCRLAQQRVVSFSGDGTVYGAQTIFHSLVTYLGATNAAAELGLVGWGKLSHESQTHLKPDFIIANDEKNHQELLSEINRNPLWRQFPAVKNQRLIRVPSRYLLSVSHYLAKAGEGLCGKKS